MLARELRRCVGQFAIVGFDGPSLPVELPSLIREFDLGGIILFARNVVEPAQVAELAREAQSLAGELPLWVSVDQEGGRVARLRDPFTEWPPMRALGRSGDLDLVARFARALAAELDAVGITLDFAPVVDVHTNPANAVIGDRALSDDAEVVARVGAELVRALQAAGIAACAKHFPGHGDTWADSHVALPVVETPIELLRDRELRPFRAAAAAGVAAVMTGHLLVPAVDDACPATLSRRLVTDLLRGELGYDGLIVTDDLQMGAIAATHTVAQATVAAVGAGCDIALLCGIDCHEHASALEALIHAAEDGTLSADALDGALARQRRAKERFLAGRVGASRRPSLDRIGRAEARAIAAEMAQYA